MKKELTCIVCPLGCSLEIEIGEDIIVKGNKCEKGKNYAIEEIKNPKRILTTTIKIKNGKYKVVPVKTTAPIPKEYIFPLLEKLSEIEISAPVPIRYKVLENIFQLSIDVITTRPMETKENTRKTKETKKST
jgi:CxxC motif-containing protein